MSTPSSYKSALAALITVFFFWGFLAASNSIFIPFCKKYFELSQLQSQFIDSAFYGAYFIGSLILYLISVSSGFDVINRMGYKKSIIVGICISIVGSLLMIAVAGSGKFELLLAALFVIALGFSLQQTAANPFALALGDPATGSHRLNLGGGVNSFGTTIGPLIVSYLLFGGLTGSGETDISSISNLYIFLTVVFVIVIVIFGFTKMPNTSNYEKIEGSPKATIALLLITAFIGLAIFMGIKDLASKLACLLMALGGVLGTLFFTLILAKQNPEGWGAMRYPQLIWGMIAIFIYVGVEVTIGSNLGALLNTKEFGNIDEEHNSIYIALYWGSLMIGRWIGALSAFKMSISIRNLLTIVLPVIAFGIILGANYIKGNEIGNTTWYYLICIFILIGGFFMGRQKPALTLLLFSILATIAMIVGLLTTGTIGTFAFMSGGLFCSVMWPCIFSLSTAGLGKYTPQGAAFLVMMILGGAIIPPLQGHIADTQNVHWSYFIPVVCFAALAFYSVAVKSILKKQDIDYDASVSSGH